MPWTGEAGNKTDRSEFGPLRVRWNPSQLGLTALQYRLERMLTLLDDGEVVQACEARGITVSPGCARHSRVAVEVQPQLHH